MTGRPGLGKARARGNIEELRSGALRVRVYAGIDPVTKKRHNLIEVVPPGPKAWRRLRRSGTDCCMRSPRSGTRGRLRPSTNF